MHTNRFSDVTPYEAPGHHGMTASQLQGGKASTNDHFWCGLSLFQPKGGAEWAASATEKVYVLIDGEITVATEVDEVTLYPQDSCRIAAGETRMIVNKGKEVARMLVISATAGPKDTA